MNTAVTHDWYAANQRSLMAAVANVRAALERHAAHAQPEKGSRGAGERIPPPPSPPPPSPWLQPGGRELPPYSPALTPPAALETLCMLFGLSPFERDTLVLCAG